MVLDPILFREEATALAKSGHDLKGRLQAQEGTPDPARAHRMLDAAQEATEGSAVSGTTGRVIDDLYGQVSRTGMRVGDVLGPEFRGRLRPGGFVTRRRSAVWDMFTISRGTRAPDVVRYGRVSQGVPVDRQRIRNQHRLLAEGQPVLAEGAQGTLLDIDFGSYISSPPPAGLCRCLHGPRHRPVAYRRGVRYLQGLLYPRGEPGPFPTGLFDETGNPSAGSRA